MKRFLVATMILLTSSLSINALAATEKAKAFKLKDAKGVEHSLDQYKGKYVVLEWTNQNCPFVKGHYERGTMTALEKKLKGKDLVYLAVNSTHDNKAADTLAWEKKWGVAYPTLMDNSGKTGKDYGAKTTPHMYVIDPKGEVIYNGAIDDDSTDEKKVKLNYVDNAVTLARAGKAVNPANTKPYGCSVKYKN